MLTVHIPKTSLFNSATDEFFDVPEQTLTLEHSLFSVAEWESTFLKPFLTDDKKTQEETIGYIKCMITTPNVDPNVCYAIPSEEMEKIINYIGSQRTATKITRRPQNARSKKIVTSEELYQCMIALEIPFECQYWHLSRLLTLIEVCSIKNQPPKKMPKADILRNNAALNAKRRAALKSRG